MKARCCGRCAPTLGPSPAEPARSCPCIAPTYRPSRSREAQSKVSSALVPPTSSTPWIEYDGGYSARCVTSNGATVLLVDSHRGAPALAAPRTTWGLHVDDPNLALGDLVAIVRSEAMAYVTRHPLSPAS